MPELRIIISDRVDRDLRVLAEHTGMDYGEIAEFMISSGLDFLADYGTLVTNKERKERTKEKKEKHILLNNNNKTSFLEEGGVGGGTSFLDPDPPPKPKRKTPKRNMPVHWVDIADKDRIPPENLLEYANKKGFDDTQARIMFGDFVNFHLKKGNQFAAWDRAWYTWVRNQIKFGLKSSGDVVRYHKKINPNEGF